MEWFFAFDENASDWFSDMIKVAVISAMATKRLEPHCLYDGKPNALTKWLSTNGVTVHPCEVPFKAELSSPEVLQRNEGTHYTASHAAGAFLRTSASSFAKGHTFAYTDCDVMFLDGRIADQHSDSFHAVPEHTGSSFNSGVMLINKWFWKAHYDGLVGYIRENGFYCREHSSYDQVLLNRYFAGQWGPLPSDFNWRPFQGLSMMASIVHFHGPKPHRINAILKKEALPEEANLVDLINRDRDAYAHYLSKFGENLSLA